MSSPRQRQLLLALVTAVTVGSTVLVATANAHREAPAPESWVASWAMAPAPAGAGKSKTGFTDQTIRMIVRTSVGGTKARVRFSNRYGTQALTIGHATVALPWPDAGPGDLKPGSVKDATFSGQKSVTIPPGGTAVSDAVDMEVPWGADLAVSVFLPVETGPSTWHVYARQTAYIGSGDQSGSASGANLPETRNNYYFVTGVDVFNRTGEGAIVVLGDSITDGFMTTVNASHRWTNYLATRLNKESPGGNAPGILNAGLTGNRLTGDGTGLGFPELGANGFARFYSDVVAQPGVDTVILALGINDIWLGKRDANTIIAAMQQIAALAKADGIRVLVATLSPWNGFESAPGVVTYTPSLDSVRLAVNSYIRTTTDFDGIIDFDMALRNPADPTKLRPEWDSGDHIHPNDAGNEAMAKAIPLDLLLWDAGDKDS
ncbi:lysophospholipase L1-like esterase [Allocatelliglobosispora scoriae]|uniref:Lysophospholipase L1-like esterase n=1 Tax=Allocatelliglobosispora scoriae TaxID=643052 RepID=A0A841BYL7_9ACTN|nr:GDSL-type esterase/lipase family protein [Allocatelliglobosispora scoriae]MBB5872578.1 lysophospholipase L1-like esterase [Allocatelliglobosispora scoriae]